MSAAEVSGDKNLLSSIRRFWLRHRAKALWLAIVVMGAMGAQRLAGGFATLARAGFYGDVPNIFHDLVPRWFAGLPVYAYSYLAVHPPATYALLWPVFGPLDVDAARAVWIALLIAALGALVFIAVRASLADSATERMVAALMPVSMYATLFTVRSGQFGLFLIALLIAGLTILKRSPPSWTRDALAAFLLLLALVKPTVAAPFMWIALFLPGGLRPVLLASLAYAALTIFALSYQPGDVATLFHEWQGRTETLGTTAGNANVHRLLGRLGMEKWLLPLSFSALGIFGYWTYRNRDADLWALLGVAAVFARFWTYHRDYDDILMLLPAIALFRAAKRASSDDGVDVIAGLLLASIIATWVIPIKIHYDVTVARMTMLLWVGAAVFLALQAPKEKLRLKESAAGSEELRAAG